MKPQDIVVLLSILNQKKNKWTISELAESIKLSDSETHASIKRNIKAGLLDEISKEPIKPALEEFLIYGLRYVFPAEPGKNERGLPTAHSVYPLSKMIVAGNLDKYVWPYENGKVKGMSIQPLYKTVPYIAEKNKELYELFSLVDSIRIGKVRERKIASDELVKRIRNK